MAKNKPFFTIAIPVYNREEYIKDAVHSILAQNFQDFELIIVDNHSEDGTWKYLQTIVDTRVKIFRNKHNLGMVKNWAKCISYAKGKWFKFLMSDDIFLPNCLNRVYNIIIGLEKVIAVINPGIPYAQGNKSSIFSVKGIHNREIQYVRKVMDELLLRKKFIYGTAMPNGYTLKTKDLKKVITSNRFDYLLNVLGKSGHCMDYFILQGTLRLYKNGVVATTQDPTYVIRDHSANGYKSYSGNLFFQLSGDRLVNYSLFSYHGFEHFHFIKHILKRYLSSIIQEKSLSNRLFYSFDFLKVLIHHVIQIPSYNTHFHESKPLPPLYSTDP